MVSARLTISDDEGDIWPILTAWGKGHEPTADQLDRLVTWTLNRQELAVWQLPAESVRSVITTRAVLMQAFCARLDSGDVNLPVAGHWTDWIVLLWTLWMPLAERIHRQQQAGQSASQSTDQFVEKRVFIQGILGAQGTGKTTLTQILSLILGCLGQRTVSLSIDDLYLSYAERCELKRKDPRLIWRGPPGTHDVSLGVQTLTKLKYCEADQSVMIPQFDKSLHGGEGDRIKSKEVRSPTIVLFEGWFTGTQPLPKDTICSPNFPFPVPIVSAEDRQFARDCNQRLVEYLPLWALIDDLIVLQPQDYRFSLQWRQDAERKMIAQKRAQKRIGGQESRRFTPYSGPQNTGQVGMNDKQISEFVRYFWKALHPELFITPLTLSQKTSLVVNIDRAHQLSNLCLP